MLFLTYVKTANVISDIVAHNSRCTQPGADVLVASGNYTLVHQLTAHHRDGLPSELNSVVLDF